MEEGMPKLDSPILHINDGLDKDHPAFIGFAIPLKDIDNPPKKIEINDDYSHCNVYISKGNVHIKYDTLFVIIDPNKEMVKWARKSKKWLK